MSGGDFGRSLLWGVAITGREKKGYAKMPSQININMRQILKVENLPFFSQASSGKSSSCGIRRERDMVSKRRLLIFL